eukprot:Gregarina_sp_Pseudo_9__4830@NODE_504_length_2678_cov_50_636605_g475_i0_p2_GENE_NODE_504_length_2678_cov_50_636605_g475_i0NODE_504_length_2678_cov_50_636605_g475_i0_p2_ORF_typecomplete_len352_score9_30PAP2/PF01569_21/2_4e03PAP2/PF01569_21/1_4e26DUF202/PF02656_15/4_1e02DUF202/PF02656_15/0_089PAP2_3/PF14378_6/0_17PAP2_3/PF14378_6/2_4e03ERGIC_N/PF13850_6/9_7e02ERGIC_N/PF13850_6/1_4ArAE_2_N/PF10337_9/1_2DUF998/PF06197_13/8_6e03DUF998/PF06197_13/9_2DUF998/PF06197_13/2_5e03DUF998/PF06197_13/0_078FtsX/P
MKSTPSKLSQQFGYDWVFLSNEIVVRIVIIVIGVFFQFLYPVFIREVQGKDWPDYAYPYKEHQMFSEALASVVICVTVLGVLLFGICLLKYVGNWTWRLCIEELVLFVLGASLSAALDFMACTIIKKMYGRLRPDYLSRCFGNSDPVKWMSANSFASWQDVPDVPVCNDKAGTFHLSAHSLADGRMSFPSGHTSLSFAIVGFAALWCYSKLCLFGNLGSWRIAVPFGLLMIPTAIAVSRTSDYRHHPSDVVGATLIGAGIALLCYCFYFPLTMTPLASTLYVCHSRHTPSAKLAVTDAAKISHSFMAENLDVQNPSVLPTSPRKKDEEDANLSVVAVASPSRIAPVSPKSP